MGIRVECDWCHQPIKPGEPYVTVEIDGQIIRGHPSNDAEDVGGPARVYCGLDRYTDDDPAANGYRGGWGHRESCARRMLAALNGNPEGRTDMGLEWRLVAQQAPSPKRLIEAPVGALEVNGRTRSALQKAGIATVRELARMTEAEWRAIPGISENGAQEILTALHKHENVKPKALVEKVRSNEAEVTA